MSGKCRDEKTDHRIEQHHQQAFAHPLPDAAHLAGTVILSAVGCHGNPHRFHRLTQHNLHLAGGRDRSDHTGAERIDRALDNGRADGGDRKLSGHRQADIQQAAGQVTIGTQILLFHPEDGIPLNHIHKTAHAGNQLRDDRCVGRTGHAGIKVQNKQQVHADIEHR